MFLSGVFLLVCLWPTQDSDSLVGPVGARIGTLLQVVFGHFVSYLFPLAVMYVAVCGVIRGRVRLPVAKAIGIALIIMGVSGLLALPGADNLEIEDRRANFERAGAVGTFLVEYEGLGLNFNLGPLGTGLTLGGLILVGLVLVLEVGPVDLIARGARRVVPRRSIVLPTALPSDLARLAEEDEAEARAAEEGSHRVVAARRPRRRWFSWPAWLRFRPSASTGGRSVLLTELDEAAWEEPADSDVAAVARALEAHEWESRTRSRIRYINERYAAGRDTALPEDEEDSADQVTPIEGALEEEEEPVAVPVAFKADDIIFRDHTGPLPVTTGNPANTKKEAVMTEGLSKLFPSRWPKGGNGAKSPEELREADEARELRRAAGRLAEKLEEPEDDESQEDPLFSEGIDTRPRGPLAPEEQADLFEQRPDYELPPIELLNDPPVVDARMTREEMLEMSDMLIQTLADFGVEGKVTEVHQGPVVTRFEFRPAAGIKVSRIVGLENDIAMSMKALSVRIMAPIPGKAAVGIEVPNKKRQGVYLKELISCSEFWEQSGPLCFALGKTIEGAPYFADLAKMPHLLIAGATGAGKSVCLNTIICSILYRMSPDRVRMIMVDPKRVELSVYADIPHLISPVVCDAKRAASALEWAVEQMEERYKKLVDLNVRNIEGYNRIVETPGDHLHKVRRGHHVHMPHLVVVVDELADLMIVARAEVEESIQRLAQMARAVGIHLILATQRPSVNVITGIIKANFPSRIAFQVSQKVDSRTILDSNGAETLLGRGDMLFSKGGAAKPTRIQGCFVSDEEVERIAESCRQQWPVDYLIDEFEPKLSEKEQRELARMMGGEVGSMDDLDAQDRMVRGTNKVMGKVHAGMFIPHDGGSARDGDDRIDEALVRAAARIVLESRSASVSLLQRRLKTGYARAGRLMDMLHEMGLVGKFNSSKPRDILVDPDVALEELDRLETSLSAGGRSAQVDHDSDVEWVDEEEYDSVTNEQD
jgi:S-DNA-T family DNA segregation ATPase FtsK/SpoIIIE